MNNSYVIETLRRHEQELRAAGILHLRLFGSVARGEERMSIGWPTLIGRSVSPCSTWRILRIG
jgi:hypothetical protein